MNEISIHKQNNRKIKKTTLKKFEIQIWKIGRVQFIAKVVTITLTFDS